MRIYLKDIKVRHKSPSAFLVRVHKKANKYSRKQKHNKEIF